MVSPGHTLKNRVCGIDEAGKGPALGPMVIAGVACPDPFEPASIGVMDSKVLSPRRREELYTLIVERYEYAVVIRTAREIDQLREEMTMNDITARAHAEVVRSLDCREAYVDACDVNEGRYGETVGRYIGYPCIITSRHKADQLFPVVSAASIVAKVTRDAAIRELEKEYGTIGSGYPSDPVTITFLKEYIATHEKPPAIARSSWATVRNLMKEAGQTTLF